MPSAAFFRTSSLPLRSRREFLRTAGATATVAMASSVLTRRAFAKTQVNWLGWQGYEVLREFYYNDGGNQIHTLVLSTQARICELGGAPFEERARMMRDHGVVGRRFAGAVTQIISGSIGYDDWEWGVDLFADDPLVFKKLVYEMRFDDASAWYAEFGPFYLGLQFSPSELPKFLDGEVPALLRH